MAKITSFTMTLSRKISDGDYGSFGAEVSATVELDEGEKVRDAGPSIVASLEKQLVAGLEASNKDIRSEKKKK
jgi:hypothetical protein